MRSFSRAAAATLAGLVLLAIGIAGWRAATATPVPPVFSTPAPRATVAFPSAEPSFDVQLPLTVTTVETGKTVTISGNGARQFGVRVTGGGALTVGLDCNLCDGSVRLISGDRTVPLLDGRAPLEGSGEVDPGERGEALLRVDAVGRWTITLKAAPR